MNAPLPISQTHSTIERAPRIANAPLLGDLLLRAGAVSARDLNRALNAQARTPGTRLGQILTRRGFAAPRAVNHALARQRGAREVDLANCRPDPRLIDRIGADACLRLELLPVRRAGAVTLVATARPAAFARLRPALEARLGPVRMALAAAPAIRAALVAARRDWLTARAEARPPQNATCATLRPSRIAASLAGLAIALATGLITAPLSTLSVLTLWAAGALSAMTVLRALALWANLAGRRDRARRFASTRPHTPPGAAPDNAPRISILVPLLNEAGVTDFLVSRLTALNYPAGRLEILFVVEEQDGTTGSALGTAPLAPHMRVIHVPPGHVRTKPRALNYALDFCQGELIGIYDAEDAPQPDQLLKVAAAFEAAAPDVACVQGRLEFYNARDSWLARAFAVDYAAWFGVLLPGLARLRFAIPLGGTTLFIKREVLERIGRWDAHNVTEDADLGIRLARNGYRTEIIDTATAEEAVTRLRPWLKQRSRWLKGYAITYLVHMRDPRALWAELGPKRFFGFQTLFLGSLSLFLLAPVLWSFWLVLLGLGHPLAAALPGALTAGLIGLFLVAGALQIAAEMLATAVPRHRWLFPWLVTMPLYFPLATLAAYRALIELAVRPFHWEKTEHGLPGPL
ncbi:MAG: glycosyltransferase [Pseudomonadota bacterium]